MTESAQLNTGPIHMVAWYHSMSTGQKIVCYAVSLLALPIYVGFAMLAMLLYCQLGKR